MVKNGFSAGSSVFGRPGRQDVIERQDVTKIFIQPPIDSNENNSDVNSGDEEDRSTNNLSGNQLLAPVSLVVKDVKNGEIHVEQKKDQQEKDPGGSNCSDTGSRKRKTLKKVGNETDPAKKKAKEAKEIHVNVSQHKDIQNADDLSRWTFPEPVQDLHDSPVTLFELFMTDTTFVKRQAHTLLKGETIHLKLMQIR